MRSIEGGGLHPGPRQPPHSVQNYNHLLQHIYDKRERDTHTHTHTEGQTNRARERGGGTRPTAPEHEPPT